MLYVTSLILIDLITGSLYPLSAFIQFPQANPCSDTTDLISFSTNLDDCF